MLLSHHLQSPCNTHPAEESIPIFLVDPLQLREGRCKLSPEPPLYQAKQTQLSKPVLKGEVSQPSDDFCSSPLDLCY